MKTKVKICGLRNVADTIAINENKPDFAGMILARGFKRTIDKDTAQALRNAVDSSIPLVGVFFNDTIDTILDYLQSGIIQIAQLHGQEPDTLVQELKKKTDAPIWKVFQMKDIEYSSPVDHFANKELAPKNSEINPINLTLFNTIHQSSADLVLLDAGTGSGETFDWQLLKQMHRPYILAGGLNPENVADAIKETSPYAVDTSSGVETDGRKDPEKIRKFIENARCI